MSERRSTNPRFHDLIPGFPNPGLPFAIRNSLLALTLGCCIGWMNPAPSCAQEAIESGREALRNGDFPWYDATLDDSKTIQIDNPPLPASQNRNNVATYIPPVRPPTAGGGWWANLWSSLFSGTYYGLSIFMWILIAIGVVLAIALFAWLATKMEVFKGKMANEDLDGDAHEPERIKELPFELQTKAGDLREQALAAFEAGNVRLAMVLLFSHVLLLLDRRKLIRLRRGKTNRQYLREVSAHNQLAEYYQQVMVPFEETFFGDHALEKQIFENCWAQLDAFHTTLNQTHQVSAENA